MRKVSDRIRRENQSTYFNFNTCGFWKSRRWWNEVEKYGSIRKVTDGNIIRHLRDAIGVEDN